MVSVDPHTAAIKEYNQTLVDALGYTKEEIIGRPIFDLYHPDCLEDVQKAFQSFVETGGVEDAELQLKRQDGSPAILGLSWRRTSRRKRGPVPFRPRLSAGLA